MTPNSNFRQDAMARAFEEALTITCGASDVPSGLLAPPPVPQVREGQYIVDEPSNVDVLCGRGSRVNNHPGNVQFRQLVSKYKDMYLQENRRKVEKAHICAHIIDTLRATTGAKFLKQSANNQWEEIGDVKARKKAGQALREDATEINQVLDQQKCLSSPPLPPPCNPYSAVVAHHFGFGGTLKRHFSMDDPNMTSSSNWPQHQATHNNNNNNSTNSNNVGLPILNSCSPLNFSSYMSNAADERVQQQAPDNGYNYYNSLEEEEVHQPIHLPSSPPRRIHSFIDAEDMSINSSILRESLHSFSPHSHHFMCSKRPPIVCHEDDAPYDLDPPRHSRIDSIDELSTQMSTVTLSASISTHYHHASWNAAFSC